MSTLEKTKDKKTSGKLKYYTSNSLNEIHFLNVCVKKPTQEEILSKVNFHVKQGEKWLLLGKSGVGKTSMLRLLAQLWPYASGEIVLPKDKIFFVPQRPYLPLATLRKSLVYPQTLGKTHVTDAVLKQLLEKVGLSSISSMLGVKQDWTNILSLGELQRINFLRILLHRPSVIVMDEPTSALDPSMVRDMFDLLHREMPLNTTILTTSYDEQLAAFHDSVLRLEGVKLEDKQLLEILRDKSLDTSLSPLLTP